MREFKETFVILGDGASLTRDDVESLRDAPVSIMAINYSIQLAPFADVFYYYHEESFDDLVGGVWVEDLYLKGDLWVVSTNPRAHEVHPWKSTEFSGKQGLELDPEKGLRSGGNSGYAAINLAVQMGAKKIILLGFDCGEHPSGKFHWLKAKDDETKPKYAFDDWNVGYNQLAPLLAAEQVEVLNASRFTRITAFPQISLQEALDGASNSSLARVASPDGADTELQALRA